MDQLPVPSFNLDIEIWLTTLEIERNGALMTWAKGLGFAQSQPAMIIVQYHDELVEEVVSKDPIEVLAEERGKAREIQGR
jgi:hypothetical protein